ncbi:MAG: dephospho-CoA kinase [Lachnospiraceae bacterium]|nr:dephospho-CoA kinase [Lachnospiraceae bacterium]
MRVIGITGGVGCGKTKLLQYMKEHYNCRILMADDAAGRLQEPGEVCYEKIVALLGKEILQEDGHICKARMAERIFADKELLAAVNAVVHPAVRDYIVREIEAERTRGSVDFFFLEAALLIECGYETVVDEMWYIYAKEAVRRKRLKEGRAYSDEKIDGILRSQLPEHVYREHCRVVIDNSGEAASAYEQIDKKMGDYLWKK